MGVISSLASMRNGHKRLHGIENHGDIHYTMAVNELDFILGSIEKFNFFTPKIDGFSKDRVMILLGIASGFGFNTD
jgi:hypothetical protein